MQDAIITQQVAPDSDKYVYRRYRGNRQPFWTNRIVEQWIVTKQDYDLMWEFCWVHGYWPQFSGVQRDGLKTTTYKKVHRGYVPPYTRKEGIRCQKLQGGRESAKATSPNG